MWCAYPTYEILTHESKVNDLVMLIFTLRVDFWTVLPQRRVSHTHTSCNVIFECTQLHLHHCASYVFALNIMIEGQILCGCDEYTNIRILKTDHYIKAYGFYFWVGVIFMKTTKAQKMRKLPPREHFHVYSIIFITFFTGWHGTILFYILVLLYWMSLFCINFHVYCMIAWCVIFKSVAQLVDQLDCWKLAWGILPAQQKIWQL